MAGDALRFEGGGKQSSVTEYLHHAGVLSHEREKKVESLKEYLAHTSCLLGR
jgi:hypothetical protein